MEREHHRSIAMEEGGSGVALTLYEIKAEIRGRSSDERRAIRHVRPEPIVDALKPWLETQIQRVSGRLAIAQALRYGLSRWQGATRYLADGLIEIDTNVVERSIRPMALNRKNALFAGYDEGCANWALVPFLIETVKLNGVNPHTC